MTWRIVGYLLSFGFSLLLVLGCHCAACCAADAPVAPPEDLPKLLAAAPQLSTEELCHPVRTIREGMLLWCPNPDEKTYDLLQIYFPQYGGPNTIIIIDLGSGELKTVQTERGWNFHLCPSVVAPNGKLFISILDGRLRQKICIYDPASNELKIDAVPLPDELLGETHPLVLGTDGKLYAIGAHPSRAATAAQIDPDTLKVTFYGPIGPSHAPSGCWGYSGGADDRFIYIASGKVPWYLVAYDRQTGQSHILVTTENFGGYVSVGQRHDGCTGSASGVKGQGDKKFNYWLYEGKAIPVENPSNQQPPWPARPPRQFPPRPEVNTALAVPDAEGWGEIWVRDAQSAKAGTADQQTAQRPWKKFRFQCPLYPQTIYRLRELPDGRIFGTAGAYEGNLMFDPKTGVGKHLGKIGLSHYSTAISGGKIYMSGYPTSPLYVYDPDKPWTAGTVEGEKVIADDAPQANPRRLLLMGLKELAGTHKMYAAATAADGKVFFGGVWVRDGSCGGLAWYDPATGQAAGMWKPFSNYQITHMAAVDEGRTIVISTRAVNDPVLEKPRPDQGALFFFDPQKAAIRGQFEPVVRARGTGPIVAVGGSRLVGWTEDPDNEKQSILYAVDASGPKLLWRKTLPWPLPVAIGSNQQEAWDFRLGPDGKTWTFVAGVLVRIDPADGRLEPVGKLSPGGPLAFADGKVYLGGTTAVRCIKDLRAP